MAVLFCRGWKSCLNQSVPLRFSSTFAQTKPVYWRPSIGPLFKSSELTRPSHLHILGYPTNRSSPFSRLNLRNDTCRIRTFQHMSRPAYTSKFSTNTPRSSTLNPKDSISKPESEIPTAAEQRRTDWTIAKRLIINVWPKNDWKTRLTVIFGFLLLVIAKVCNTDALTFPFRYSTLSRF